MGDDSRSSHEDSILNELSVFWESLSKSAGDKNPLSSPLRVMTVEDIKKITKALSQSRRQINRKIETLNKEIELNSAKLESLQRTGGHTEDILQRIQELTEQGYALTQELERLDQTLKVARQQDLMGQIA